MPDEAKPSGPSANVNIGTDGSGQLMQGMPLWAKVLVTLGLTGFITGIAWALIEKQGAMLQQLMTEARQDRLAERQQSHEDRVADRLAFVESVNRMQTEADRHAGEYKGATDKNTEVLRELIAEMKSAKHEGRPTPQGALPKAGMP